MQKSLVWFTLFGQPIGLKFCFEQQQSKQKVRYRYTEIISFQWFLWRKILLSLNSEFRESCVLIVLRICIWTKKVILKLDKSGMNRIYSWICSRFAPNHWVRKLFWATSNLKNEFKKTLIRFMLHCNTHGLVPVHWMRIF